MTTALPTEHVDRAHDLRNSLPPAWHPALVRGDVHHHGEGLWGERGPPGAAAQTPGPGAAPSPFQASPAQEAGARARARVLLCPSRAPVPVPGPCQSLLPVQTLPVLDPPKPPVPSSPRPLQSLSMWPGQRGPSSHMHPPPAEWDVSTEPLEHRAQGLTALTLPALRRPH